MLSSLSSKPEGDLSEPTKQINSGPAIISLNLKISFNSDTNLQLLAINSKSHSFAKAKKSYTHPWENLIAYLLLLQRLMRASLLPAMPHKRSGQPPFRMREPEPWAIAQPSTNTLPPSPRHTEKHATHWPSGPLCTHGTKTGPFSLPSFLPSFPRLSRPSQLNGLFHYQPLKSPVTEAPGGDRGSGHFSQGAMAKLGWDSFRFNLYSASFWFNGIFTFMALEKHLCQNTHHSVRPAEEVLYNTFPCAGINGRGVT